METDNVICSYTWDNAIEDGTFIRIDDKIVQEAGYKYPLAFTNNLFSTHIKNDDKSIENGRIWDILWMMKHGKMDGNMVTFKVKLGNTLVTLWGFCEARSPNNPEPILTVMKPEDY